MKRFDEIAVKRMESGGGGERASERASELADDPIVPIIDNCGADCLCPGAHCYDYSFSPSPTQPLSCLQ